jgi:hypothetical protein
MADSLRRRATRIGAVPVAGQKELRMRFPRARDFWCPTVSEPVLIRLARPHGLTRVAPDYFVQCDQADCQYVDTNAFPCPLRVDMFRDDIARMETARAALREGWSDDAR